MVPLNRLHFRFGQFKYQPVYLFSIMLLFYAIFDGIFSFIFPISIENAGFSKTMIGVIIGSSSVVGAFFDFVISKSIRNTHFRRMYLMMFAICFLTPIVLYSAKPLWVFLLASGLWGIYYDFYNFGRFDFMSRITKEPEHCTGFGLSRIFTSVGYMLAPIIAGIAIGEILSLKPYILMYLMLIISFIFFSVLLFIGGKKKVYYAEEAHKPINFLKEIHIWKKIGKMIFPLLILTMLLNIIDASFWTIGPLLSESYGNITSFNGLFLTFYELPPLIIGWFIGKFTLKFGKKRTAFISFIIGSLLLSTFPLMQNPILILTTIFFASMFIAISWPSINGAYVDYISETRIYESEIEALDDFFTNIGYIVGPISAGILADRFGNQNSFIVLGLVGAIIAYLMWKRTPKEIIISKHL